MGKQRILQMVRGDAARIASHAALRLAWLGDDIEPVSPTEFVWRPQPAERKLFRCPRAVRVQVVPGDDGASTVLCEWRAEPTSGWLRGLLAGAGLAGVAAWLSAPSGWPGWQLALCAWPPLVGLLAPFVLDSGWRGRLERAATTDPTPVLARTPEAARWLTLDDAGRERVLSELRERAADTSETGDETAKWAFWGTDRRSAASLLGWPLWHIASGRDPVTGQARTARGWYARGQFARGLVAMGQSAVGWLAVGQLARGLLALGQAAIGVVAAVGQVAFGGLFGLAQFAVGLAAIGQVAFGRWAVGAGPVETDLSAGTALWLALGVPAAMAALLLAARAKLLHTEQRELEARLAELPATTQVADETSLSLAARLTGEDAERGLSPAEATEDARV